MTVEPVRLSLMRRVILQGVHAWNPSILGRIAWWYVRGQLARRLWYECPIPAQACPKLGTLHLDGDLCLLYWIENGFLSSRTHEGARQRPCLPSLYPLYM